MPLLYSALALWIISRAQFFTTGIAQRWIQFAFIYKVILGLANYYIWLYVIGRGDVLNYIHDADMIYGTLFEHPLHYLQLTFGYGTTNVYPEHLRYISDPLKYSWETVEYTLVRINAILHVFTFGNAWANTVILDFAFFAAAIALFKYLSKTYPEKITLFFIIIFLIPSITIWSSGLLKEGFALAIISLLLIQFLRFGKYISRKTLLQLIILFFALFIIREYVVLLFIPNIILWLIARKNNKPAITFIGITFLAIILLIIADALSYTFTISEIVCEAQQYFILFEADPDYTYHVFTGYALWEPFQKIPYALNNIFFRPNILHSTSIFRLYMAVELMITWAALLWLLSGIRQKLSATAWLFILIAAELLMMYGLVVTDADTMSRYRVIPIFLLLIIGTISTTRTRIPFLNTTK